MDVILALDFKSSAYLFVNSMSPNCLVWSPDLLEIQVRFNVKVFTN